MKKILVALFIFCQFSFFVEALDELDEFEEAIETLDELDKLEALDELDEFEETIDELDKLDEIEELDETDEFEETIETKSFYEIEYDDLFFEIGILFNLYSKDDCNLYNKEDYPRGIYGMGVESKFKNSYIFYQNCIDLVYIENNIDFIWSPTLFLGNSIVKIGAGTPLGIGGYTHGDNLFLFISIGVRPSVKLTIGIISFEAYYQHLTKCILSTDYIIETDEIGLILKINTDAH